LVERRPGDRVDSSFSSFSFPTQPVTR
jgi:hypothetical protein